MDLWLLLRVFPCCFLPGKPGKLGKASVSLSRWERRWRYPGGKWSRRSEADSRCQVGAEVCLSSLGSTLQFLIPGLALFPGAPGLWQPLAHSRPRSMLLCLLLQKIPAGMGDRDAGMGDNRGGVPKSQSSGIPGLWGGIRSGSGPALGWGHDQGMQGSSSDSFHSVNEPCPCSNPIPTSRIVNSQGVWGW